jgi:hypothetical protein
MRILSKTLANGDEESWRVVFDLEELHLFVGFTELDAVPVDGMTVEDFLVTLPANPRHAEARDQLVLLLQTLLA